MVPITTSHALELTSQSPTVEWRLFPINTGDDYFDTGWMSIDVWSHEPVMLVRILLQDGQYAYFVVLPRTQEELSIRITESFKPLLLLCFLYKKIVERAVSV